MRPYCEVTLVPRAAFLLFSPCSALVHWLVGWHSLGLALVLLSRPHLLPLLAL